jgi:hypothetical protein
VRSGRKDRRKEGRKKERKGGWIFRFQGLNLEMRNEEISTILGAEFSYRAPPI